MAALGMTVPGCPGWFYVRERRDAARMLTVELVGPDAILVVSGSPYWCDLPALGYPHGIHSRARRLIAEQERHEWHAPAMVAAAV